jgi:hypothetical protein
MPIAYGITNARLEIQEAVTSSSVISGAGETNVRLEIQETASAAGNFGETNVRLEIQESVFGFSPMAGETNARLEIQEALASASNSGETNVRLQIQEKPTFTQGGTFERTESESSVPPGLPTEYI